MIHLKNKWKLDAFEAPLMVRQEVGCCRTISSWLCVIQCVCCRCELRESGTIDMVEPSCVLFVSSVINCVCCITGHWKIRWAICLFPGPSLLACIIAPVSYRKVSCIILSNCASHVTVLRISVHASDVDSGSCAERAICVVGVKNVFDSAASIEHLPWLMDTMLELSELLFKFQNIKYIFNLSLNCFQHNNM
jgi:hypothetical protein